MAETLSLFGLDAGPRPAAPAPGAKPARGRGKAARRSAAPSSATAAPAPAAGGERLTLADLEREAAEKSRAPRGPRGTYRVRNAREGR